MDALTKAEEQIMQVLWELEKAFVKEILENFPEPKPAYNTVSTIIRILQTKGVVGHESIGRSHQYYPLISKEAYRASQLKSLMKGYFGGSMKQLVSAWMNDGDISLDEIEEIRKITKNNKS